MRFQDTPGTYTRPSSNSLWRDFFHLGGLWMPGVCSRGMLGFSNGPNECCWHGLSCCVENLEFSELWAIRIHFNYIGCFGRQDVLSWNYIESAHYFLQAHEVYLCTCEKQKGMVDSFRTLIGDKRFMVWCWTSWGSFQVLRLLVQWHTHQQYGWITIPHVMMGVCVCVCFLFAFIAYGVTYLVVLF